MRSVESKSNILPFPTRLPERTSCPTTADVGPLRRVELHQVEHDEVRSLRERLLQLILDNERERKFSRFRLVN